MTAMIHILSLLILAVLIGSIITMIQFMFAQAQGKEEDEETIDKSADTCFYLTVIITTLIYVGYNNLS